MTRKLISWIGNTDLRAPDEPDEVGSGPIAQAIDTRPFEEVLLLTNHPNSRVKPYICWLRQRSQASLEVIPEKLPSPIHLWREPAIEGLHARNVDLHERSNAEVLVYAATNQLIVVLHDINTMPVAVHVHIHVR